MKLIDFHEYWRYLQTHPQEWQVLDSCCDITISRFYRDHEVYDYIYKEILPDTIKTLQVGDNLRIWSAGCCSGEEPYTMSLISAFNFPEIFLRHKINIVATDINRDLLQKAKIGAYKSSSLRELPENWKQAAFELKGDEYYLKTSYKKPVKFLQQDIKKKCPQGFFHLVLCRNLVAMYFDQDLQVQVFEQIANKMDPGGFLVLGKHEVLPQDLKHLELVHGHFKIYRKL